ncbi:hypothetical protein NDU88_001700 [Pleurodeles waltl]|uniref:Uncharacterized protein n=1 Tax=Pleurodeles waltl TaxID=8319 RepID=A0AAV7SZX6_PLEWA|nr:hypothetical protein NDU88_001700 [Pleurodeles waltl]
MGRHRRTNVAQGNTMEQYNTPVPLPQRTVRLGGADEELSQAKILAAIQGSRVAHEGKIETETVNLLRADLRKVSDKIKVAEGYIVELQIELAWVRVGAVCFWIVVLCDGEPGPEVALLSRGIWTENRVPSLHGQLRPPRCGRSSTVHSCEWNQPPGQHESCPPTLRLRGPLSTPGSSLRGGVSGRRSAPRQLGTEATRGTRNDPREAERNRAAECIGVLTSPGSAPCCAGRDIRGWPSLARRQQQVAEHDSAAVQRPRASRGAFKMRFQVEDGLIM